MGNPFQIRSKPPETVKDLVCGMLVDPAKAAGYLNPDSAAPATPVPAGAEYTCPMHPEVIRSKPGSCPFCGMALEPKSFSAMNAEESNPELDYMTKRFRISLWFTAPLFVMAMAGMVPGLGVEPYWLGWVELARATPVVLWAGLPFFERAWSSLQHHSPNMFTLIGLGTGVAYLYSLVAVAVPGIFTAIFSRASRARTGVF